jgi:hypothetical protein
MSFCLPRTSDGHCSSDTIPDNRCSNVDILSDARQHRCSVGVSVAALSAPTAKTNAIISSPAMDVQGVARSLHESAHRCSIGEGRVRGWLAVNRYNGLVRVAAGTWPLPGFMYALTKTFASRTTRSTLLFRFRGVTSVCDEPTAALPERSSSPDRRSAHRPCAAASRPAHAVGRVPSTVVEPYLRS